LDHSIGLVGFTTTKAALIHLELRQKTQLAKRARSRGYSFSQEVGEALDFYLDIPPRQLEELQRLAPEASRAADRILKRLDETTNVVGRVVKRMGYK